jgi:hypothetical protein
MANFSDSLRGYGHAIFERDGFKCRYCGLDGSTSFNAWLTLSCHHLLPKEHPDRDNPDYIVTACTFCNTADNRYFDIAQKRGLSFTNLTPEALIEQRKPYIMKTRNNYLAFWKEIVVGKSKQPV